MTSGRVGRYASGVAIPRLQEPDDRGMRARCASLTTSWDGVRAKNGSPRSWAGSPDTSRGATPNRLRYARLHDDGLSKPLRDATAAIANSEPGPSSRCWARSRRRMRRYARAVCRCPQKACAGSATKCWSNVRSGSPRLRSRKSLTRRRIIPPRVTGITRLRAIAECSRSIVIRPALRAASRSSAICRHHLDRSYGGRVGLFC